MTLSALPTDRVAQHANGNVASSRASPLVWLLIGYMWLFIHRPFEIWPILGAYHVERVYMIATLLYWLTTGPSLPRGNRLHAYFAAFIVVMLASWLLSPYQADGDSAIENYLKYAVFYLILVTSVWSDQDLRWIIIGHFWILTIFMLHTLRESLNGNAWYAQGIVRTQGVNATFRDPNDLAGLIVCSLPFSWVVWRTWKAPWQRAIVLAHFAMAGYCVMLTGSRMGAIGMVLGGLIWTWGSPYRWRLLAICPVLLALAWTILPESRKERYLTLFDPSAGPSSATASAAHFRSGGFDAALPVFEQWPLLGCGPMAFGKGSGMGHMAHNLYGQLIAELGASGAIAFGLILFGVLLNALEALRIVRTIALPDKLAWETVMAASASFLLLAIMAWGFNFLFWHVWLWFGGFQVVALRLLNQQAEEANQFGRIAPLFRSGRPI
jgi:hypothetical protein